MEHDDLWEHMALTRLRHVHGMVTPQERQTFRRGFTRAVARRRDKPGISPMGTVRTYHDRPHHDGGELLATIWRAIDHGMGVADEKHETPHVRPAHRPPTDLGGRHGIQAMVPHQAWRDAEGYGHEAFSSVVEVVLPEVPAAEAPVACRLPTPDGSWVDVRRAEGRFLRPLMAPGGWSTLGLHDLARLAAGREPWIDSPFAPVPPQHRSVLPLEAVCPPGPTSTPQGRAAQAEAQARVGSLGLCIVDGVVHIATPPPELTSMVTPGGEEIRAMRTWRLGWLTGLHDMRTEARREAALPDTHMIVGRPDRLPFHDLRGWRRPLLASDMDPLWLREVSEGGRSVFAHERLAEFVRPDLMPGDDSMAGVRALDRVLAEVGQVYEIDAVQNPYAQAGQAKCPRDLPAPRAFASLRETVGTVIEHVDEGLWTSDDILSTLPEAIDGYLAAPKGRHGMPGDRLGVLGQILRPAFDEARQDVRRLLDGQNEPDLSGLSL